METTAQSSSSRARVLRRRLVRGGVAAVAMAAMGVGLAAAPASAMDKGAFKDGCQASGGSFIENPDGSFQCNLKSGGTIKCTETSPCTYTANFANDTGIVVHTTKAGIGELLTLSPGSITGIVVHLTTTGAKESSQEKLLTK